MRVGCYVRQGLVVPLLAWPQVCVYLTCLFMKKVCKVVRNKNLDALIFQWGCSCRRSVPNRSGDKPRAALLPAMRSFTFLRLTDQILQEPYASEWRHFMYRMRRNGSGRLDPEADPYGPPNYSAGMKLNMV